MPLIQCCLVRYSLSHIKLPFLSFSLSFYQIVYEPSVLRVTCRRKRKRTNPRFTMPCFAPFPIRDERCFTTPPSSITVLIVGAGVAGLFASYPLAKHSIRSVIVERHELRLGQPKAHAINPLSLEIFRQAGLNTDELRRLGSGSNDAFWVRFNTRSRLRLKGINLKLNFRDIQLKNTPDDIIDLQLCIF